MPGGEYVFDLDRILFGKLPWLYLLEILLRTSIMYVYALFIVRTLGKRGMGQLAPFDFVIIIALGSAVGDPMFYPDVPLFHALVAITAIVLFTRGLVSLTQRHRLLKQFLSTSATRLVTDGVMDLEKLKSEGISREELFSSLRGDGIQQLGEVERAYLEPSGSLSVFQFPEGEGAPGVPLLPEEDIGKEKFLDTETLLPGPGRYGCWACGTTLMPSIPYLPACPECNGRRWIKAVERVRDLSRIRRRVSER